MEKKRAIYIWIISAVLLVSMFVTFLFLYPISLKERMEIKEAWSAYCGRDFTNYIDLNRNNVCGLRYYGSHNGYTILFEEGPLTVLSKETIGNEVFSYGSSFVLYAYRDGQFHKLKDVYEAGEITDQQLQEIAKVHDSAT